VLQRFSHSIFKNISNQIIGSTNKILSLA